MGLYADLPCKGCIHEAVHKGTLFCKFGEKHGIRCTYWRTKPKEKKK